MRAHHGLEGPEEEDRGGSPCAEEGRPGELVTRAEGGRWEEQREGVAHEATQLDETWGRQLQDVLPGDVERGRDAP